ncbi:MAG: hypothetical protein QM831_30165 [Kofleriaceae bacterium]
MSIVGTFVAVGKSRAVTAGDMKLALAALETTLPAWRVTEDAHESWMLERRDGSQEMAIDGVDVQGFDEAVISMLGQWLANRVGKLQFEDDAGSDPIVFAPAKGSKRQPAPRPVAPKQKADETTAARDPGAVRPAPNARRRSRRGRADAVARRR